MKPNTVLQEIKAQYTQIIAINDNDAAIGILHIIEYIKIIKRYFLDDLKQIVHEVEPQHIWDHKQANRHRGLARINNTFNTSTTYAVINGGLQFFPSLGDKPNLMTLQVPASKSIYSMSLPTETLDDCWVSLDYLEILSSKKETLVVGLNGNHEVQAILMAEVAELNSIENGIAKKGSVFQVYKRHVSKIHMALIKKTDQKSVSENYPKQNKKRTFFDNTTNTLYGQHFKTGTLEQKLLSLFFPNGQPSNEKFHWQEIAEKLSLDHVKHPKEHKDSINATTRRINKKIDCEIILCDLGEYFLNPTLILPN